MFQTFLSKNKDLALVGGMILILIVLFAPIPPVLLDFAIIINFGFGLTILLLTFYVKKPVEFSTFPSLLLITTLFRLSLNVAATRLILTGADAGEVIDSIGSFAVSGNFVVGLVVFLILVVVQYVVVTSGAQRVSEVAARFTLDSMPGQQMSIDADLNMGLIDQKEAVRRREELEKEAAFYGSMDGASKFVKGDAIAGVVIILIDIIAGWIIGVAQMGMGWEEALQKFSLLTIGDGIATQIPALVIAIATGIIVTRSSADRELSQEVFKQLSSVPRIPLIVGGILTTLLLLPGMPKWPIVILIAFCGYIWLRMREVEQDTSELDDPNNAESDARLSKSFPALEIAFGEELASQWEPQNAIILDRVASLRESQESELGIAFPGAKLIDSKTIGTFEYDIRIFGTTYARSTIHPEMLLAILSDESAGQLTGIQTKDPAFGLPAIWIDQAHVEQARSSRYTVIDPLTVMVTHLGEVMRAEAAALLTRSTVVKLIDEVRDRQSGLVEELLPNLLTVSDIQKVLQRLLSESVSIANIDMILEHLVDLARQEKDPGQLTELVRQRMSLAICNQLKSHHQDLAVISLDPKIENKIQSSMSAEAPDALLAMDPKVTQSVVNQLAATSNKMHSEGRAPVLLCGAAIRRQMRALTQRSVPKLSVLSVSEIPMNIQLRSYDVIRADS